MVWTTSRDQRPKKTRTRNGVIIKADIRRSITSRISINIMKRIVISMGRITWTITDLIMNKVIFSNVKL